MTLRLHAVLPVLVSALLFLPVTADAQSKGERDSPSVDQPCPECAVVYEVNEIRRERESLRTLKEQTGPAGPQLQLPFGANSDREAHVEVFGNREMRESMVDVTYEVVVRFDDNRWRRIEVPDASGLKVGDRVHVHQNQIKQVDRNSR